MWDLRNAYSYKNFVCWMLHLAFSLSLTLDLITQADRRWCKISPNTQTPCTKYPRDLNFELLLRDLTKLPALAIICDVNIYWSGHIQSSAEKHFLSLFNPSIGPLLRNVGGMTCTLGGVTYTLDKNISAICSLFVDHQKP